MEFRSRKINKKRNLTVKQVSAKINPPKNFNFSNFKKIGLKVPKKTWTILISLIILSTTTLAIFNFTPTKNIVTQSILKTIGSDIKKDKDGYTNILALGIGGEGHEGGQLTDTIILASIHEKNKTVLMTSIPRDLYAKHENIISQRINSVYQNTKQKLGEELAVATVSEIISEFTNQEIHYYAKIDFQGLKDIVDSLGGVEVYVKEAIYDTEYPGPNFSYQTFSLPTGFQNLDGDTALKFARSRKSTSDFSRSDRQQQLILAIKEKALKLNILTSPDRINDLYKSVEKNIGTNLSFREITTLAAIASNISSENLVQVIFTDDPNAKGGFLYSPPRSLYADAYVLLPADKTLSQIHTFINLHKKFPEIMKNPLPVDVFNGTKTTGLAGQTAFTLQKFGFKTAKIANLENREIELEESKIQTSIGAKEPLIKAIQLLFTPVDKIEFIDPVLPNPEEDGIPSSIKVIVGKDMIATLKFFDTYSSLAPLIQQAIQENRQKNNPELNQNAEEDIEIYENPLPIIPNEDEITEDIPQTIQTETVPSI